MQFFVALLHMILAAEPASVRAVAHRLTNAPVRASGSPEVHPGKRLLEDREQGWQAVRLGRHLEASVVSLCDRRSSIS